MSERTRHAAELVAQDVDKLLRLSASLRGIKNPVCPQCHGDWRYPEQFGEGQSCTDCNGSGDDTRREKRLIQAVTDTLKPYGLTWQFESSRDGRRVGILFSDGPHDLLSGALHGWMV